ncbi:hypothetical protein RR48_14289 [Papilio machaon]|uniref:Cilia- and flagella-associated protein 126 n=1 Tax=Papilio machaon TaxID=76193 RepID=A0A194QNJ9_PAPMA|nr:hypothetical protein RR48_14289 [Papilio machaon]
MGNWQVPRWSPTRARPLEMRPDPKPICDINGHFLPGAPKGSSKCFGHFTGTWDLPRKINRKVAEELAKEPPADRFADWLHPRVQRPKVVSTSMRMRPGKRGKAVTEEKEKAPSTEPFQDQDNEINADVNIVKESHILSERKEDDPLGLQADNNEPVDSNGHGPYVPGSVTDPKNRHESYDILLKDSLEKIHGPKEHPTDLFWRKVAENAKHHEQIDETMKYEKKSETPKLPYVNVSQNFQFAKKMHVGNLEHQPLPDTLGYRHLTKVGEHRDSDIVVKPYAIGWKGYGASGPTCCTKMRVHRPKTCDPKKTENEVDEKKQRPSTSALDLGGQYKKPMSLMDLAICWDFRPDDAKLEPSPPKHIDGSNGSKAPAVFTMVHTPKEEIQNPVSHSVPIFNKNRIMEDMGHHPVPYFEKDMTKEKRKDSCDVQYCSQHNANNIKSRSSSRKSSSTSVRNDKCDGVHGCGTPSSVSRSSNGKRPDEFQTVKDAWNSNNEKNNNVVAHQKRNSLESYDKTPLAQGKLHQSSPNESISKHSKDPSNNVKHKHCFSCNGVKILQEPKQKEDYKFAFKAGNPNSVQSVSSSDSKNIKMPKMRHPYTKKSYTIPTLAPPFSIWRDANATGYPEHWRLASVYQHAYKPPEQRRKPLINSVYQ